MVRARPSLKFCLRFDSLFERRTLAASLIHWLGLFLRRRINRLLAVNPEYWINLVQATSVLELLFMVLFVGRSTLFAAVAVRCLGLIFLVGGRRYLVRVCVLLLLFCFDAITAFCEEACELALPCLLVDILKHFALNRLHHSLNIGILLDPFVPTNSIIFVYKD